MPKDLEQQFAEENRRDINYYIKKVDKDIDKAILEFSQILSTLNLKDYENFTWSRNKSLENKASQIIAELRVNIKRDVVASAVNAWNLCNVKNNELVKRYLANIRIEDKIKNLFFDTNFSALNEWVNRTDEGINLSNRVWKLTSDLKGELQTLVGLGITEGKPSRFNVYFGSRKKAKDIADDIMGYLKHPELVIKDEKTGKITRYSTNAHPGRGVYADPYKNAARLARTETNLSYRMSDFTKRQQLPFVTGIRVDLSGGHQIEDMCDQLKGQYPKGFIFTGWHPQCLCFSTSILLTKEEARNYLQTGLINRNRYVSDIPKSAMDWVNANSERMNNWKSKPYWIKDNFTKDYNLKQSVGSVGQGINIFRVEKYAKKVKVA